MYDRLSGLTLLERSKLLEQFDGLNGIDRLSNHFLFKQSIKIILTQEKGSKSLYTLYETNMPQAKSF